MYKYADILTKLQEHQERARKRALVRDIILAHSTGSGKTLTAIAAADALGKPTTVLTPASLVENFRKELAKHKKGGPPVEVLSLPTAVSRQYQIPKGNTVIIDEAHSLRNEGTARQQYVKEQLRNAARVIALTGTPAYNDIADWSQLVNLVARKKVVPSDRAEFRKRYIKEKEIRPGFFARLLYGVKPGVVDELQNADELKERMSPYVDIFDADIEKPERQDEVIEVPMNRPQIGTYKYVSEAMPTALLWKLTHNLPPSKQEAKSLNAFYSGVRQVANTPEAFSEDPIEPGEKIKRAVQELKARMKGNKGFRALVYSNYLGSGIDSYGRLLDKEGIPYRKFTGQLSAAEKKSIVDAYNRGEVPVILGSGSASEGLDLKGTRLIQILEPHFNNAKLDQVIGRGIRYKSHDFLPPDQRNVTVQKYISTFPQIRNWLGFKTTPPASIDQYLTSRAEEKDQLIDQVKNTLMGNTKVAACSTARYGLSKIITFFDVKNRKVVRVPIEQCYKCTYTTRGNSKGVVHAVRAVTEDGTKLTRFVQAREYRILKCEERESSKQV